MCELLPGDVISDSIAFTGSYEDELSRRLARSARAGGLLVDVGANIGYMSLLWAAQSADARAIAIEASPRVFPRLRANVAANRLMDRVTTLNVAAGRDAGSLPFDLGPEEQTGWGGLAGSSSAGTINVDVVRLDVLLKGEPQIDVLKIDVEGADAWVLMGAEQLLRRRVVREIWFEENLSRARALGIPLGAGVIFVEQFGYRLRQLSSGRDGLKEWHGTAA